MSLTIQAQDDDLNIDIPKSTSEKSTKPKGIRNSFKEVFSGEPGKAAFYSLIIPGGGQAYNRRWWKIPIAVGVDAATIYYAYDNRSKLKKYQNLYITSLETNGAQDTNTRRYKLNRDAYRKRYDYARAYVVIGHVLTIFDAYIDNHMKTFDVSDDLSLGLTPNGGLGVVYTFD